MIQTSYCVMTVQWMVSLVSTVHVHVYVASLRRERLVDLSFKDLFNLLYYVTSYEL